MRWRAGIIAVLFLAFVATLASRELAGWGSSDAAFASVGPIGSWSTDSTADGANSAARSDLAPFAARLLDAPNGELAIDSVLQGLADLVGLQVPPRATGSIDLRPLFATLGLLDLGRATNGLLAFDIGDDGIDVRFDRSVMTRAWSRFSSQVADSFTLLARLGWLRAGGDSALSAIWSLHWLGDHHDSDGSPAPRRAPTRAVVLVHGLDEPGWIWDDLAPALAESELPAVCFEYPNDGPIAPSADGLGQALMSLKRQGVREVDFVAHSMGGLVVRDCLTRPCWYDGDGRGDRMLPRVRQVVLVATPNHGAGAAVLQPVSEIKDQFVRLARGTLKRDSHITDGNGEAGKDLLPGSRFLRELNARPQPRHVHCTIIAGTLSSPAKARRFANMFAEFDEPHVGAIGKFGSRTGETFSKWLGDGLVSVDSAMLPGVDDIVLLSGNHQSILRHWLPGQTAPAVPLIVERLKGTRY